MKKKKKYVQITELESSIDKEAWCYYSYGTKIDFSPHQHEFYEIFLNVSGTLNFFINDRTLKLSKGSLVFIRPNDIHGYTYDKSNNNEDTSFVNLSFNTKTAQLLFGYVLNEDTSSALLDSKMPPIITLNVTEKKRLLSQLNELNTLDWEDKKSLKLHLRVILADVFVRHFCGIKKIQENKIPNWLSLLLSEMEQEKNLIGGVDKMISLSGKSREHLARSIKKYYGLTLSEYINDLRINYASNLLLHTNTPIIDICFLSGFQNVSHFYNIFNMKHGMPPREFKKNYHLVEKNRTVPK